MRARLPQNGRYRGHMSPGDGTGLDAEQVPTKEWADGVDEQFADPNAEVPGILYAQQRKEKV